MTFDWAEVALFAAKLTLVLGVGLLVSLLAGLRSAALARAALVATLLLALVLPFAQGLAPQWSGPWLRQESPTPVAVVAVGPAPVATSVPVPIDSAPPVDAGSWVWGIYGLGAVVGLGSALARQRRPRANRVSRASEGLFAELEETKAALRLKRRLDLRELDAEVPLTYGVFRPVVAVPDGFAQWPPERRRVALLHECAHVLAFDCLWSWFASVLKAVYWCHPLAWLLARRLRDVAEQAADERVLATGVPALDYAGHLVAVARNCKTARDLVPPVGVTLMSHNTLESRVARIVGPRRRGASRWGALVLSFGLAASTVLIAGASFQSAPPAPGEPPVSVDAPQVSPPENSVKVTKVKKGKAAAKRSRVRVTKPQNVRVRSTSSTIVAKPRQVVASPASPVVTPVEGRTVISVPSQARTRAVPARTGTKVELAVAPLQGRSASPARRSVQVPSGASGAPGEAVAVPVIVRSVQQAAPAGTAVTAGRTTESTVPAQAGQAAIAGPARAAPAEVVTAVRSRTAPAPAGTMVTSPSSPAQWTVPNSPTFEYSNKTGVLTVTRNGTKKTLKLGDPKAIDSVSVDAGAGVVTVKSKSKVKRYSLPK